MRITVINSGYVGVVSAVCFCEFGFRVCVEEDDPQRLEKLKNNTAPAHEPGISQMMKKHVAAKRLVFSDNLPRYVQQSDAIVVSVPIGKKSDMDSDLSELHKKMEQVALSLKSDGYTGIFIKTSVPIGTCSIIAKNMRFMRPDLVPGEHYDIIANPGVLREGSAIHDFMSPSRVLIGLESDSQKARAIVSEVYSSLLKLNIPFVYSDYETIELIRAATIGFIVTKMAFINEMAELCDRCGADINMLIKGISFDNGIGSKYFRVSPGIGGTSYPRTARILAATASSLGMDLHVINSALTSNKIRVTGIKDNVMRLISDDSDSGDSVRKVSILGLSFKQLTSDIRESASITVIQDLLGENVEVYAYDPLYKPGSEEISQIPPKIAENKNFHLVESVYEAASQSDIIVIMTNWSEFMSIDFKKLHELMNKKPGSKPIILDYRNMFTKSEMNDFIYISQGQRTKNIFPY
ncbi:MAG: nucleotide sugar dehydrogenase [Holosporales bacterium]|jgi:UDPglucose 6-dehydrogenase|nr:nucleotide sugar dehydrogenase [Holosporales bacterium]